MLNTVLYAVVSAVGAALLAAAAGYGFAKYRFRGGTGAVRARPRRDHGADHRAGDPDLPAVREVGLVNTPWAIILPSLVSPFGLYLMRVYAADAVADSLIEAARIDGAGEFRIFFQVALRLLLPGSVTVLLFTLVATWNNYFLPLIMLNDPELYPITVGPGALGRRPRPAARRAGACSPP